MSEEAEIARALLGRLDQITVFSPQPVIIHPMRRRKAPGSEMYLIGQLLYNDPVTREVRGQGGQKRGFLQVTVMWPVARDEGVVPVLEAGGLIAGYFQKDTLMESNGVRVRVIRKPWVASPFLDGAHLRCPVSIPWIHNVSSS